MDITINGKSHSFIFGIRFLREMNKNFGVEQNGIRLGMAAQTMLPQIFGGSLDVLSDVLFCASRTETPKLTQAALDEYLESLNADDADKLFDEVTDALKESNATARTVKNIQAAEAKQ